MALGALCREVHAGRPGLLGRLSAARGPGPLRSTFVESQLCAISNRES